MLHIHYVSTLAICVCGRARQKQLNWSRCDLGSDTCGSKEPCISWGFISLQGKGALLKGDVLVYCNVPLCMSAMHCIRRLWACLPITCSRLIHSLPSEWPDKTAMWPFVKFVELGQVSQKIPFWDYWWRFITGQTFLRLPSWQCQGIEKNLLLYVSDCLELQSTAVLLLLLIIWWSM